MIFETYINLKFRQLDTFLIKINKICENNKNSRVYTEMLKNRKTSRIIIYFLISIYTAMKGKFSDRDEKHFFLSLSLSLSLTKLNYEEKNIIMNNSSYTFYFLIFHMQNVQYLVLTHALCLIFFSTLLKLMEEHF